MNGYESGWGKATVLKYVFENRVLLFWLCLQKRTGEDEMRVQDPTTQTWKDPCLRRPPRLRPFGEDSFAS